MEPTPTPPAAPAAPAPPATPAPAQPAYMPPQPPDDSYADGGQVKKLSPFEICLFILGVTGVFFVIHYYNEKTKALKKTGSTISQMVEEVDQLKHEFSGLKKAATQPQPRY